MNVFELIVGIFERVDVILFFLKMDNPLNEVLTDFLCNNTNKF